MSFISDKIDQRRTFAIIAHPDAGKTTLTEKLLLFGGAIQLAGAVKARGEARRAHSDWMKVERERGISVASSVMSFDYTGCAFNLLDTPGHEDFSEDTYRTLTAVDSAVMVIDSAKGIEEQTRKLFEVCRLRDVPIITFINKLDRDGREPLDLLDEIEQTLALDVTPATWPIGMGRDFLGCYDLLSDRLVLMEKGAKGALPKEGEQFTGLDDPKLADRLPSHAYEKLVEDVEMVRGLCPPFDRDSYRAGHLSPVFFGSAVNNFGVRELLNGIAEMAPSPRVQNTTTREVLPDEDKVTGFVFKIQANMDPKHRDRIAFVRICSGHFKKGMKLTHVRTGKQLTMHAPTLFLAQDRELAEEAFAGDIIGVPNHGQLRIADALTEGESLFFTGIPSFAPEMLQKARPKDPLRAKHLGRALSQLAEEGAAQVFKPRIGADWIVGVVGPLQFDVLADRIRTEYDVPVIFEPTTLYTARWVSAEDPRVLKAFVDANQGALADDHDGDPVFLARNAWHLDRAAEDYPKVSFHKTKEHTGL
ncbi:peptide chain release factor 3 [Phaeovibrio sulfidiphilus]|uniref:Peptide chain release factor 3 n=1 Tax=Phaeovibrio sulfidiphilus TaxID=1220600 RepID=A0A8J6YLS2_9PROT|nr:peptide chain release factor 3 [Phaeovibrio sulfidiphilus]MBE1236928.1 peptide chain release factor 3 [Phaeovibrio sulfidiphilus]